MAGCTFGMFAKCPIGQADQGGTAKAVNIYEASKPIRKVYCLLVEVYGNTDPTQGSTTCVSPPTRYT
jgi:hypothetical protein